MIGLGKTSRGVGSRVDESQQVCWYIARMHCFESKKQGQAVVEFTLVFILFLIVALIPGDFGLAFYTNQIAQNAAREAARIGASDPTVSSDSCLMASTCSSKAAESVLGRAAGRLRSALLSGGAITLTLVPETSSGACDSMVRVRVTGAYNFFFFGFLNYLGVSVPQSVSIDRTTEMRWEHQC